MGEHLPWKISSFSHRLDALVLGLYVEKTSLLTGWRATGKNIRAVGSLDSVLEEHMYAG